MTTTNLFAIILTLIGPAPKTGGEMAPGLQLKAGDQIVAIGDSITRNGGYLRVMDAVFAQQYADLKLPKIINAGISGQEAGQLVKRFDKDVVQKRPALVTICIGVNDVNHRIRAKKPYTDKDAEEYAGYLRTMVKMAQDAKIRVVLVSPAVTEEYPETEANVRLAKYVAAGKQVAEAAHCPFVNLHELFLAAAAKNLKAHPEFKGRRYLTRDGVHMLPRGDVLIAAGILRAVGVPDEKMLATDLDDVFAPGLFRTMLTTVGPRPPPTKLELQPGEQILAIGDSITNAGGYLRCMDAVFSQRYPDLKLPPIINAGVGGNKSPDLLARFEKDVIARKPAVLTLNVGINDVWHHLKEPLTDQAVESYARDLDQMVKTAKAAGIRVILVSPTVIQEDPKAEGNVRLIRFLDAGRRVARENDCPYVDLRALFLAAIEHHAKETGETRPKGYLTADGVHMKPPGDALMAIGILRAMGVPDEWIAETNLAKAFPKNAVGG